MNARQFPLFALPEEARAPVALPFGVRGLAGWVEHHGECMLGGHEGV